MRCDLRTALLAAALLFLAGCRTGPEEEPAPAAPPLFALLPPERTNVTFSNTLSQGLGANRNALMYEYFYNGGGVAVGDVNGDGLDDLYFTGNMTYNKLYLNRGGLVFEDVTDGAGVAGRKNTWKTGVTFADVNGDGRLDLYVCYSGQLPVERRIDELYINQGPDAAGIPRFEEQAAAYGLANPHSSNTATFFDYDRDGDLDLFLLNHNVKALPILSEVATRKLLLEDDPLHGVRLYRNDDGRFRDVTRAAGISSSPLTYGLGVGVSDVNDDGWPDLYISNDYSPPDYLYINNGDGTFTDRLSEYLRHTSYASMGTDVADVNNDALPDLLVLDMLPEDQARQKLVKIADDADHFTMNVLLGFHRQYMRNTLHLNNGNDTFSEIGQLAGISNTDWSWAPLLADYDNDGWKDLFVTNGLPHDVTNLDYLDYTGQFVRQKNGRLQPEDIQHLLSRMPSTTLPNHLYRNRGDLTFEDVRQSWGMSAPLTSNGAAYADLDNDGDLDLVTNNLNAPASIFENRAGDHLGHRYLKLRLVGSDRNTFGIGAKVTLWAAGQVQHLEQMPSRGYLSSVSPILHFGLGRADAVDSLRVVWPDGRQQLLAGISAGQLLTVRQEDAVRSARSARPAPPLFEAVKAPIDFRHAAAGHGAGGGASSAPPTGMRALSGPVLATADVNGDALPDVFVGGGRGQQGGLYLQRGNGRFEAAPGAVFAGGGADVADALFFDADGDEDPDLYLAYGGDGFANPTDPALQDRLYRNDGGRFTPSADALPPMYTSTGAVASADVNGDGHLDVFVGGRIAPGSYPSPPRSYLLVNDGSGRFEDRTAALAPGLERVGMVTDAAWHDLDGDRHDELIVVGEWMPVGIFGQESGSLADRTEAFLGGRYHGLWNTVFVGDLNGDGHPDLLAGNLGLNAQLRASGEAPVKLHYGDFDDDGSVESILTYEAGGRSYPYETRDELSEKLAFVRFRYASYAGYAAAALDDILDERELQKARSLRAEHLETALFLSDGGGRLRRAELPLQAQFAPVFAVSDLDFDADGRTDLLLAGNYDEPRVRFGRYDASYGTLLRGDGEGGFSYVPQHASGFDLRGDVRSLLRLGDRLLVGIRGAPVQAYRLAPR